MTQVYHPLLIAICTLGRVRIEWAAAFTGQSAPFGRGLNPFVIMGMTTIDARNRAVEMAREKQAEYLMFWDDDVIPRDALCLERMMATIQVNKHVDVIGGVYPVRRDVPNPIVVKSADADGPFWDWRDGKAHKVHMVGTGFMVIRMASFDEVTEPFFAYDPTMSDDFYFANVCKKHGKQQYIDGSVICDQIDLDSRLYRVEAAMGSEMAEEVAEVGLPPRKMFRAELMPGGLRVVKA